MTRAVGRIALGFFLLFLGVLGLILPVMPGWVFIIPGLWILSRHFRWPRHLLLWVRRRLRRPRPMGRSVTP